MEEKRPSGARLARIMVWAVAACAVFCRAPAASAVTLDGPGDAMAPRLQAWANAAAVPTAKATIVLRPEECRQDIAAACTLLGPSTTIYYPDLEYLFRGQGSDGEREAVYLNFLHELGHVYDFTQPRHPYRLRFLRIMHLPLEGPAPELSARMRPEAWMQAGQLQPDEQFAMAYAYCAAGLGFPETEMVIHGIYWGYGYNPSERQYDATCGLLAGRLPAGASVKLGSRRATTRAGSAPAHVEPSTTRASAAPAASAPPGAAQTPALKLPQPPPLPESLPLPPLGGLVPSAPIGAPQPPPVGLPAAPLGKIQS